MAHYPWAHAFHVKNPLCFIDATVISLRLSLFDWARFRKTKEGQGNCMGSLTRQGICSVLPC